MSHKRSIRAYIKLNLKLTLIKITQRHKIMSSLTLYDGCSPRNLVVAVLFCERLIVTMQWRFLSSGPQCWQLHLKGPFGGSLVFSGDPAPPHEDAGRRSRGPSPGPPLSRTAPGRLEQLDQDEDEDHTHLKKVRFVCCLPVEWTLNLIFSAWF